jgi:hypothetical protein
MVIDSSVGRHTLVSREDHPDSPSLFRIAEDTTLDLFKWIFTSPGGFKNSPLVLGGHGSYSIDP